MNLQPELRRSQAGEVEARLGNSGRHQGAEHGGLQTDSGEWPEVSAYGTRGSGWGGGQAAGCNSECLSFKRPKLANSQKPGRSLQVEKLRQKFQKSLGHFDTHI